MSEQPQQNQESAQREALHEPQVPRNLDWHLDGLQQRKLRQLQRRAKSPFNFPAWSILLMLVIVMAASAAIAFAVFSLRASEPTIAATPVISITAAVDLNPTVDSAPPDQSTKNAPGGVQLVIAAHTPENLQIDGPILPTVVITLTPLPLTIGASVEVADVGDQELNVRNLPGLIDSTILFRAPEGTSFQVIDGPQQAGGFTWWRIRDRDIQVEGWAAANYLRVTE